MHFYYTGFQFQTTNMPGNFNFTQTSSTFQSLPAVSAAGMQGVQPQVQVQQNSISKYSVSSIPAPAYSLIFSVMVFAMQELIYVRGNFKTQLLVDQLFRPVPGRNRMELPVNWRSGFEVVPCLTVYVEKLFLLFHIFNSLSDVGVL